eukprot:632168-Amphidinium_carterae.1
MVLHFAERWQELSDTHRESGLGWTLQYYDTRPPEHSTWQLEGGDTFVLNPREVLGTTGVALHPSFQAVPDPAKVQQLRDIYEKDVSKSAEFKTRRQPGETTQAVRAKVKAGAMKEVQTRPGTKPTMPTKIPYPFGPYATLRTRDAPQSQEPHEVSSDDGRKEHADDPEAVRPEEPPGAAIKEHLLPSAPEEAHTKAGASNPTPVPPVPKWQGPRLTPEDLTQMLAAARKEADKQLESIAQEAPGHDETGRRTDLQVPHQARGAAEERSPDTRGQHAPPIDTAQKTEEQEHQKLATTRDEADKQHASFAQLGRVELAAGYEEAGQMSDTHAPHHARGADEECPPATPEQHAPPTALAQKTEEQGRQEAKEDDTKQEATTEDIAASSMQVTTHKEEQGGTRKEEQGDTPAAAQGCAAEAHDPEDPAATCGKDEDDEPPLAPAEEEPGGIDAEVRRAIELLRAQGYEVGLQEKEAANITRHTITLCAPSDASVNCTSAPQKGTTLPQAVDCDSSPHEDPIDDAASSDAVRMAPRPDIPGLIQTLRLTS